MTIDRVLEMSYTNAIMYSSVLPSPDDLTEDEQPINADDPYEWAKIRNSLFG